MPSWYWMKRNQETKMKEKIFRIKYSDKIEEIEINAEAVENHLLCGLSRFTASDIQVEEIHEGLPVESGRKVLLTIESPVYKTEIYDDGRINIHSKGGASGSSLSSSLSEDELKEFFKNQSECWVSNILHAIKAKKVNERRE